MSYSILIYIEDNSYLFSYINFPYLFLYLTKKYKNKYGMNIPSVSALFSSLAAGGVIVILSF